MKTIVSLVTLFTCVALVGCVASSEEPAPSQTEEADSTNICIGTQPSVFGCAQNFHSDTSHDHAWWDCPAPKYDLIGRIYVQGVLGKDADVARYKGCPGYATLSVPSNRYSHDLNRQWMYCVATGSILDDVGWNSGTVNLPQFQEVSGTTSGIYAQEDCYLKRSQHARPPGIGAKYVGGGQFLAWQQ